jgi:tetratricopeptide (TPR) repeat protein
MTPALLLAVSLTILVPQDSVVSHEDPIAISEEMKLFIDEHIDSSLPEYERLVQLVRIVFQENRLGFSYEKTTKTARQTFEDRSGNCLSFTNMLVSMARYLDLEAEFREVEVPPIWSLRGRLIVLSRHINVAVKIGAVSYVVDLFPEINPVQIGGQNVSDERGLAHFFNNRGAEYLANGQPGLAAVNYQAAAEADPEASFVWVNMGVARSHQRRFEESEECYLKALKIDGRDSVAMSNLADLYRKTGDQEKAEKWAKKVERFRKKNPYYHFALGERAYGSGDFEAAVGHYRDALKRNSREHHFHFALAKAYMRLGKLEEVASALEKAKKHAPDEWGKERYDQKLEILAANF